MRARFGWTLFAALTLCRLTGAAFANDPASIEGPKFTFILFWKEDNAATREMAGTLKAALEARSHVAEWDSVRVGDPANQATVDHFKVSRAPMPMVLCVAPNGAVTTAITDRLTEERIDRAIVTPTMTRCIKALQDGKLVLVHVMEEDEAPLPHGAREFASDPEFQARTITIGFHRRDPQEARFVADMKIDPQTTGSVVTLLAPPSVLVGRFTAYSTKEQIASQLHASGKCCDDPNCKHNKKGK